MSAALDDSPADVREAVTLFVDAAKAAFAEDLESIVLFGSAAEGRLRPTSDVNLALVLRRFDHLRAEQLGPAYRLGHAAVRLGCMFLLSSELAVAADAFAAKFADIQGRHRVLFGPDPFEGLKVSRVAIVARLTQVLTNLAMRLREQYVLSSSQDDAVLNLAAEAAGPLRAAAATIAQLEGKAVAPREALLELARRFGEPSWQSAVEALSAVREQRQVDVEPAALVFSLLGLTDRLRAHVGSL